MLKDESLKSVNREFASLSKLQPENRITVRRDQRVEEFSWVNDIDYTDTDGLAHKVHVLQCDRTDTSTGKIKTSTHRWVGNVKISQDRAMDVADEGGWIRWKIVWVDPRRAHRWAGQVLFPLDLGAPAQRRAGSVTL